MAFAQLTRGLNVVNYKGAFDPADSMWTKNWTNFNPQNAVYGAPTVQVTGYISANTTWKSSKVYQLNGPVMVINGATLTIEAGTVIRGNAMSSNSSLIITRGCKIMANGTEAKPIVFTSSKAAGLRAPGDWGGVIILGNAKINPAAGQANIEGLEASSNSFYGGNNDNDNSGVFQYARIEFGGYIFSANNEINGLTMGGVGNGTTIRYVQTSFIKDDAFEWFGGTVNCSHLVSYRCTDDDFDTDFGYSGCVQFGLVLRDPSWSDGVSGGESNGFESDNDGTGTVAKPFVKAIFSNITMVGPYRKDSLSNSNSLSTFGANNKRAVFIRRNSNLRVINSVFTDFKNSIHVKDNPTIAAYNADSSYANTLDSSNMCIKNCVFASMNVSTSNGVELAFTNSANLWSWHGNTYYDATAALFQDTITNINYNMNYRPRIGSPIASGADFTHSFALNRTRVGPGLLALNVDSIEIGNIIPIDTVTLTANNMALATSYTWTVPTGVNIINGQGTRTLKVFMLATAKNNSKIYCQAYNLPSRIFSNADSIIIKRTKPNTFRIVNLTKSTSEIYTSAPGATNAITVVTVTSTAGLTEGATVIVTSGIGAFKANTTVTKVINSTTFSVSVAPTTILGTGAVVSGFVNNANVCGIVPNSGNSTPVAYKVYAPAASNIVGYTFVAPTGALIQSVGSKILPTPATSWSSFDSTRTGIIVDSITVIYPSTFLKGNLTVTPYNTAGAGTKFTLAVAKGLPLVFKVTGNAAAASSTVTYTAVMGNGTSATSYIWTIPTSKVTFTHGAAAGTILANVITTTTDTLTLTFGSTYTTGALKVQAVNVCGNSTAKTFTMNNTALTKNGAFELAEEISDVELDNSLNVYPNPSKGSFKVAVNTESTSNATVSVLNLLGQVVYTTEVENNNGLIYTEINKNFEKGVYLIKVEIENETKVNKMIVE